jgi:hypothetical protein
MGQCIVEMPPLIGLADSNLRHHYLLLCDARTLMALTGGCRAIARYPSG